MSPRFATYPAMVFVLLCGTTAYASRASADTMPRGDEFNDPTLSVFWTTENPLQPNSYFSTTDRPGFLRIVSTNLSGGGDYCSCSNFQAPRMYQMAAGNWTLEVAMEFAPSDNYEGAGIFIPGLTPNSGIRLSERAFYPDGGGQVVRSVGGYVPYSGTLTYFRVVEQDGLLTGYWSADGVIWNLNGSIMMSPANIGLFMVRRDWDGQTPRPGFADFDYFRITGGVTPTRPGTWGSLKALYR